MAASPHEKKTVEQLKEECKKHEITFSSRAKKADLIALLDGYDKLSKLTVDDLSKRLKDHGMPSSGTKAFLIKRVIRFEEYTALSLPRLKSIARSKGLSDQGTKNEVMVRLLQKIPKEPAAAKAKEKTEKKSEKKNEKAEKPAGADHKPPPRKTKKGKPAPQLKIASWNLCNLVEASRHKKYPAIAELFEDYDLVAVQEVIHKEGLDELKKLLPGWDYISSHTSVGRVRKEFYAFFFRTNRIEVLASGQFDDTAKDVFEREPYVVTFKACEGNFDFTLISIHVLWGKSVATRRQELTHFVEVINAVLAQNKGERDVMLMGDFNFGPDDAGWAELKALGYKPVIVPPEKTTVGNVSLFDNIWLSEKNTADDWTGESGVVHWDEVMYGKETLKARNEISDHRPVWATFYTYKDVDDGTVGKLDALKI